MVSAPLPVRSQVRDRQRVEHGERVPVARGREIDVTALPGRVQAGCRRHEEHGLTGNELHEPLVEFGVDLTHVFA